MYMPRGLVPLPRLKNLAIITLSKEYRIKNRLFAELKWVWQEA
jgi:hypothetical protein